MQIKMEDEVEEKIDGIINRIVKNINDYKNDYKNDYIKSENKLELKDGKVCVLNNSYFSRGKSKDISTNKSNKYLGFRMKDNITEEDCFVVEIKNSFYIEFKEYDNKPENAKSLREEVKEEIKNLGEIVFFLVSEYSYEDSISREIQNKDFKKIIYKPSTKPSTQENWEILDDKIFIYQLDNCIEEKILNAIKTKIEKGNKGKGKGLNKELEKNIIKAISEIKKEDHYSVKMPDETKRDGKCILDDILNSVRKNLEEYNDSLKKYLGKSDNSDNSDNDFYFYNVLRIAYIFSHEVIDLIKFLISVGDLKPLINWETFLTKYKFYKSMERLPGVLEKNKKNKVVIKNYIDIIGKSRNKKFHRIFPFERKFKVELPDNAIKDPYIIVFWRYNKNKNKNNNKEHDILEYKDKELVKLLQKFSITEEEIVQKDFWEKNSEVIEKAAIYISEFGDVLKELREVVSL